jgi:hypothetical protein
MAAQTPILTKEKIKEILIVANAERYSAETQAEMNKVNHSAWFGYVVDQMHRKILRKLGYGSVLEDALDELYSCRWKYRNDDEMNAFFKTLIHVQMDLTADGPIQHGDAAVDAELYTLDKTKTTFFTRLQKAHEKGKPLVVFAGSVT